MKSGDVARMARFLAVGAGNTALGLAVIYLGLRLGAGDIAANALGYGSGLLLSFFANRRWTFRHSGPPLAAFWRFLLVFAVAYACNLAATMVMVRLLGAGSFLAQLAGLVPYTMLCYLGSRRIAFKPRQAV